MDLEITYNLTADQYSLYATRGGMALKTEGKKRSLFVGMMEIATAIMGMFFFNGSILYALIMTALVGMGIYSLLFYPVIFPNSVKKNTFLGYKRNNPEELPLTITFDESGVSYVINGVTKEESYNKMTLLYCDEAIVLTSLGWSAVVPKSAIDDYDNFLADLQVENFLEQRAI